jgi:hypothetical protein
MIEIGFEICNSEATIRFDTTRLIGDYVQSDVAPIDEYYAFTTSYFQIANIMLNSPIHSNVAVLALISAVELYVRHLVSGCIYICPISRKRADSNEVKIGSLSYYGKNVGRAINESGSLAGRENISEYLKKTIGIKIKTASSVDDSLKEFDKLCKLRHAAAHSRGLLSYGNARDIGVEDLECEKTITLDQEVYQEIYAVCNNVIRALNKQVFSDLLNQWVVDSVITGNWQHDKHLWNRLMGLFYSRTDDREVNRNFYLLYRKISKAAESRYAARQ